MADQNPTVTLAIQSKNFDAQSMALGLGVGSVGIGGSKGIQVNHLSNQQPRSTQPCIPQGSLNRVLASAEVKAKMTPLPGGR